MRTRHRRRSPRTCTSSTILPRSNAAPATRHLLPTQLLAQQAGLSPSHSLNITATQTGSTPSANSHFHCRARRQRTTTKKKHAKERRLARARLPAGWPPTRNVVIIRNAGAGGRRYPERVPPQCSTLQPPHTTFYGRLQAVVEEPRAVSMSMAAMAVGGFATTPPRTRALVWCVS